MAQVLVVDDTSEIREILAFVLTREGHQVHAVGDLDTATDLAARLRLDLAVVDACIFGMDPATACRTLRRQRGTAPRIVLTSACALRSDIAVAMAAGADACLLKPSASPTCGTSCTRCSPVPGRRLPLL